MANISKKMAEALNQHMNREFYSAYLYLAMAAWCENNSLPGTAHWMRTQHGEEWNHALKIFTYVTDRGGRVVLEKIDQPPADYASIQDIFTKTLEHEQFVTKCINELYAVAVKENDYASQSFLNWFIDEQVEEEKNADQILDQLKAVGEKSSAVFYIDRHLGKRQ